MNHVLIVDDEAAIRDAAHIAGIVIDDPVAVEEQRLPRARSHDITLKMTQVRMESFLAERPGRAPAAAFVAWLTAAAKSSSENKAFPDCRPPN